jgi:hypothetical protein
MTVHTKIDQVLASQQSTARLLDAVMDKIQGVYPTTTDEGIHKWLRDMEIVADTVYSGSVLAPDDYAHIHEEIQRGRGEQPEQDPHPVNVEPVGHMKQSGSPPAAMAGATLRRRALRDRAPREAGVSDADAKRPVGSDTLGTIRNTDSTFPPDATTVAVQDITTSTESGDVASEKIPNRHAPSPPDVGHAGKSPGSNTLAASDALKKRRSSLVYGGYSWPRNMTSDADPHPNRGVFGDIKVDDEYAKRTAALLLQSLPKRPQKTANRQQHVVMDNGEVNMQIRVDAKTLLDVIQSPDASSQMIQDVIGNNGVLWAGTYSQLGLMSPLRAALFRCKTARTGTSLACLEKLLHCGADPDRFGDCITPGPFGLSSKERPNQHLLQFQEIDTDLSGLDASPAYYESPLIYCIRNNMAAEVVLLVANGASVDALCLSVGRPRGHLQCDGCTPLGEASQTFGGHSDDVVRVLLAVGSDPNGSLCPRKWRTVLALVFSHVASPAPYKIARIKQFLEAGAVPPAEDVVSQAVQMWSVEKTPATASALVEVASLLDPYRKAAGAGPACVIKALENKHYSVVRELADMSQSGSMEGVLHALVVECAAGRISSNEYYWAAVAFRRRLVSSYLIVADFSYRRKPGVLESGGAGGGIPTTATRSAHQLADDIYIPAKKTFPVGRAPPRRKLLKLALWDITGPLPDRPGPVPTSSRSKMEYVYMTVYILTGCCCCLGWFF